MGTSAHVFGEDGVEDDDDDDDDNGYDDDDDIGVFVDMCTSKLVTL